MKKSIRKKLMARKRRIQQRFGRTTMGRECPVLCLIRNESYGITSIAYKLHNVPPIWFV